MKPEPFDAKRLALLTRAFLEEVLTPAEAGELETLLRLDPVARAAFCEQVEMHFLLESRREEPAATSRIHVLPPPEPPSEGGKRVVWRHPAAIVGTAAAVVLLSLGSGWFAGRSGLGPHFGGGDGGGGPEATEATEAEIAGENQKRYKETMERVSFAGSQSRPPERVKAVVGGEGTLSYNRDIRPILSDRCFACHGPDPKKRKADLRLDTPEGAHAALEGGGGWHQIAPGAPEKSEVMHRITTEDEDDMMPPPEAKLPRMTPEEVAKIEQWIREGAEYEAHWAFTRIERPVVPAAVWPGLVRNEIDRFIQEGLRRAGVEPSPEADPSTLLRRLHLDLTGLPPPPGEVGKVAARGLDEPRAAAIREELLSSIHHAEHFAARWLDQARYADTTGYQYDTPRIMWRWRDWVIDAFHDNKPYDQFLIEQIAGDLLPGATRDQIIATGYNRNHPITIEGGVIHEEYRVQYVSDRVNTLGSSVLGLTMECAKCHDHKYDPISQKDYFSMFAFFNNIPEAGTAGGGKIGSPLGAIAQPYILAPTPEQERREKELNAAIHREHAAILNEKGAKHGAFMRWRDAFTTSVGWNPLTGGSAESNLGLVFRDLGDASWLVEGTSSASPDVYTFRFPMRGRGWQSVLIEALRHESLPRGGPGRFANANAVLSKLDLIEIHPDGGERMLKLGRVEPSYEQAGYPASNLLTDPGGKGWGFFHPKPDDRSLTVQTEEPFGIEGEWTLKVVLTFSEQWRSHSYGRTRISVSRLDEVREAPESIGDLLHKPFAKMSVQERQEVAVAFLEEHDPAAAEMLGGLWKALEALQAEIPPVMVMEEMDVPRPAFVLNRGAYDAPVGDPVEPRSPEALNAFLNEYPKNRLGLARWMTSRENPLTARVAVNHLWDQFFGTGITKTVEDFGSQGEWPSHPALLDWLAIELIESGWDRQHIVRLILDSHTYRQSSRSRPELEKVDPANRLLGRGPRARFTAEMIRDQALASSGLLNRKAGGPGVNPYQPAGIWEELTKRPGYAMSYQVSPGDEIYRRSIYTFWKRAAPPAMMSVFDAPSREVCTVRRESTNTPLQALALLNGDTYIEAARALAQKLLHERPAADDEELMREAFLSIVQRPPHAGELSIAAQLFATERARFSDAQNRTLLKVGRLPLDESLPQDRLLGLTMVNRLFYNLSETITRH